MAEGQSSQQKGGDICSVIKPSGFTYVEGIMEAYGQLTSEKDMALSGADIRDLTDNGLAEAAGLISRREYNLSIVRSRQTAEFLIKSYAAEHGIGFTTLADTIESLYEQGAINRTSRDAFHNIRIYGNKAVHDGDNDPENAQKAYYLLKSEVGTFLSRKTVSVDRTPVRVEAGVGGAKQLGDLDVEIVNDEANASAAEYDSKAAGADGVNRGNTGRNAERTRRGSAVGNQDGAYDGEFGYEGREGGYDAAYNGGSQSGNGAGDKNFLDNAKRRIGNGYPDEYGDEDGVYNNIGRRSSRNRDGYSSLEGDTGRRDNKRNGGSGRDRYADDGRSLRGNRGQDSDYGFDDGDDEYGRLGRDEDYRRSGRGSSHDDDEYRSGREVRSSGRSSRSGSRDGRKGSRDGSRSGRGGAGNSGRDERRSSRDNRAGSRDSRTGSRDTRRSGRDDRSSGRNNGRNGNRSGRDERERQSFTIYDLLRILLPVLVIILLIVIIRSFMASKTPEETTVETTTAVETTVQETFAPETEAETETTEPETTEPETTEAAIEYRIADDGVNVRFADNQNRIYTQLSKGTAIGTVTPIEGSDYVAFTLDGVNVVVRKDMIEPIQ